MLERQRIGSSSTQMNIHDGEIGEGEIKGSNNHQAIVGRFAVVGKKIYIQMFWYMADVHMTFLRFCR